MVRRVERGCAFPVVGGHCMRIFREPHRILSKCGRESSLKKTTPSARRAEGVALVLDYRDYWKCCSASSIWLITIRISPIIWNIMMIFFIIIFSYSAR